MNPSSVISDDEFLPFLNSLGVETYNKSFEWMFSDPDCAGLLLWMNNNLDHNNALTAREEYRYAEIQKKGALLSPEELESTISSIQDKYVGIPLPGDQEAMEDMQLETAMLKERLDFLEKQQVVIEELNMQNEVTKTALDDEIANLNYMHSQLKDDEKAAGEESLSLAREVESITSSVIDEVADMLDLYSRCHTNKEIAKKFAVFGPLESYKQSQAMFRSHFDLYTARRLDKKQNENAQADLQDALIEAKNMEERLADAISSYINSKAALSGEEAVLSVLDNPDDIINIYSSQIPIATMEAQSAIELLEQEESMLEQQIQSSIKSYVQGRTKMVVDTAVHAALTVREGILTDFNRLHEITATAHALDTCLYYLLRHSLRSVQETVQFAGDLQLAVREERLAVRSRIESMLTICTEQETRLSQLKSQDLLLQYISAIFGAVPASDVTTVVKLAADVRDDVTELKERVADEFRRREEQLGTFKKSQLPLMKYLWDGCTKQPNCHDRGVAALTHSLTKEINDTDNMVEEVKKLYYSVKTGDKHSLRKLWQWFLTDPAKLLAVIKETQSKSYS